MNAVEALRACDRPDAHAAHLALNGECPWCGYADESQVDPNADVDDFG